MESAGLEAIIDKFLEALQKVVKGDSRFDFDEQQVSLVRHTAGEEVVRILNRRNNDEILVKRITVGKTHITKNAPSFDKINTASCPNVATLLDTIEGSDGSFWIFIDDGPEFDKLSYLIEQRGQKGEYFCEGQLAHIGLDMALGLAHLQLLGLAQRNVRPRAFFKQNGMYKVTDIALTPGGLDKTALMFVSPNSIHKPLAGFKLFKEDAHALGRILLLMMQVGGTAAPTQIALSEDKKQEETIKKNQEKHIYEKEKTPWKRLVEPYAQFCPKPNKENYNKHIKPMIDNARRCERYSNFFIEFVENLVAFDPDERLDFFSIVRFFDNYRRWSGEVEASDFYNEEIELSKERAEGDLNLLDIQNQEYGYLRLAEFQNEEEIHAHKQMIEDEIEEIERELQKKREEHALVDDFCLSLVVDQDAKGNEELVLEQGQQYSGHVNAAGLPHGIGKVTHHEGTYVYVGEWENGKRKGRGKLTDGDYVYMGYWQNDHRKGWGMEEFVGDSEWAGDKFEGMFDNDVRNGIGQYTYDNGDYYMGTYVDNERQGIGKKEILDTYEYMGEFKDDRMDGWGVLRFTDSNDVYEGQFKNDLRHGFGYYNYADGDYYIGQWKFGKQEGKGILHQIEEGYEYRGDWHEDAVDGWGIQKWQDGEIYEGEFKMDERDGFGRWVTGKNNRYQGFFKKGVRHGFGQYNKPNGYSYRGFWVDDKRSGEGFERRPNQDTYEGAFLENKHEGYGIHIIKETQEVYRGYFFSNIRQGKGTLNLPDGYEYDGMWDKNEATGYGREKLPSGEEYEGEFISMVRDGQGRCKFTNGDVYDGTWDDGIQEGKGSLTKTNQYYYEGDWKQGINTGVGMEKHPNGEKYEGDFVEGIRHGKGKYYYLNGDTYEGDFLQGIREGKGKLSSGGYFYEGDWKSDKANGIGKQQWPDGDYYEGDFVNDLRHGRGSYYYNNGSFYKGDWNEGVKHGQGVMEVTDYSIYEGSWRSDKKHGKGVQKWVGKCEWAGDVYEGDFVDGYRQGEGVYKYANGDIYEGSWLKGKRSGKGTLRQQNGYVYVGDWLLDSEHGEGHQEWSGYTQWNGDSYDGEMQRGFREGRGVYKYQNGDIYEGEWKDGKRHGKGKLEQRDHSEYEGSWAEGKKNGKGTLKFLNPDPHDPTAVETYIGMFKDDNREGDGVYLYSDGTKYEGQWKNNERNGLGRQYDEDGKVLHEGVWDKDGYKGKVKRQGVLDFLSGKRPPTPPWEKQGLFDRMSEGGDRTPISFESVTVQETKPMERGLIIEGRESQYQERKGIMSVLFCGACKS